MVPVSYLFNCQSLEWYKVDAGATYPNRIPPKATNRPTAMAGKAEPGVSAGFLRRKGIVAGE